MHHFIVVGLVSQPLHEREAEVDLVLIQTSFLFFMEIIMLKNYQLGKEQHDLHNN